MNFAEGLIHIRHRCDERCSLPDRSTQRSPIEWISPAIPIMPCAASLFEYLQKVTCVLIVLFGIQITRQKRKAHGVMRVGDRKSLTLPEQSPSRRHEGFTEDDRRDGHRAQDWLAIIELLDVSAQIARVKGLKIPGCLTIAIKPGNKAVHTTQDRFALRSAYFSFGVSIDDGWYG